MSRSVLIHVQHLLGIGHLQRSLRIAEALARDGIAVTLVSGGLPVAALAASPETIRVVQLPPVCARDASFALVDGEGRPLGDAVRAARRSALLAAFDAARPDAVVIEGYPFARRAFRFELDPLIAAAKAAGAPVVSSVRDILVTRDDPARDRAIAARVRADFAAVLVHGDPDFIRLDASFPAAPEIADRIFYTGYVGMPQASAPPNSAGPPEVLVSAGGGPVGYALLAAAVEARRLGCLADTPWRVIAGASLPPERFDSLLRRAPEGVAIDRFRADFPALLQGCRVSVSQAGYNTVLDILAARARAVLVPFAAERETEQLLRTERLAALGVAELVRESDLTPVVLAAAIERAARQPPASLALDRNGAERSARLIGSLMRGGPPTGEFRPDRPDGILRL